MCGACGRFASDWAVPLVSGQRRRLAIARFLSGVCRRVTVTPSPGAWLVRSPTGAARPASGFDELLDITAPTLTCESWPELEEAVARCESGRGDEDHSLFRPRPVQHDLVTTTVLTVPATGSLHLRLTAFGLGIRAFDRRPVALEVPDAFRLVAEDGRIIGVEQVGAAAAFLHGG